MSNKTILVIEDEVALRGAIEGSLKKVGFNVVSADKVSSALELLDSTDDVAAIWLDHYLLGEENGLDFLQTVRADNRWKDMPVFVVTNSVSDSSFDTYALLGIKKYFVKSDNSLASIIQAIQNVVG